MKPGGHGGGMRRPSGPSIFDGAPIVKKLLILNVGIFLLDIFLTPGDHSPGDLRPLEVWGAFSIENSWQLWRLLSFQFLHGDPMHLLSNMIGLFFFGPHVERWMSSRTFLTYYLLCGVAGALFYTFIFFVPGLFDHYSPTTAMVGASAGLFGILAAFYKIAPDARVLLFFFIPLKMRTFAIAYFAFEVIVVLFEVHDNAGGSAGHLGGAIFGLFLIKNDKARQWLINITNKKPPGKKRSKTRDATVVRDTPLDITKEVDRILDKISESGIQSLTKKERETLDKARKK